MNVVPIKSARDGKKDELRMGDGIKSRRADKKYMKNGGLNLLLSNTSLGWMEGNLWKHLA